MEKLGDLAHIGYGVSVKNTSQAIFGGNFFIFSLEYAVGVKLQVLGRE